MRFNPDKYDPAADSSPGAPKTGNLVIVYGSDSECRSGSGLTPRNPKSKFVQGHDARLKGALIRAAIAGVKVEIRDQGKAPVLMTPEAFAKQFGFADRVVSAKSRYQDSLEIAKQKAAERAEKASTRAVARKVARLAKQPAKATKAPAKATAKKAPAKRPAKKAAAAKA